MKTLFFPFLFLLPVFSYAQGKVLLRDTEQLPVDGVVKQKNRQEKRVLAHPPIRENDILWEKRIWRLIDTREKLNLCFRYPKKYFFEILTEGIEKGAIQAYSPENDAFQYPLKQQEALKDLVHVDTIPIYDPGSQKESFQVVRNELDPGKITRFRIKEIWYFDKTRGTLMVRILGIAPMITETDDLGNFKFERPMFWVYYPDCREWLAKFPFFNDGTDVQLQSWEDLFEMRRFASYITKESNVLDERLEDQFSGLDRLLGSERIHLELFNFESGLWSY